MLYETIKPAFFTVFLLIMIQAGLTAQTNNNGLSPGFQITYFGRLFTHPGIKIGFSMPSITNNKAYINGLPVKTTHQLYLNFNAGYYFHKGNHHGLFFSSEIAYRITFKSGWFFDVNAGGGYLRSVLNGSVFTVTENGLQNAGWFEGSNYFMPSFFLGFGRNSSNTEKKIKGWHTQLGAFWQYPFNGQYLLNPSFQFGMHNYSIKEK